MSTENRVSKNAFNRLLNEIQKIHDRVFDGIPQEIRKEMQEEMKDLRNEMRKENGITRKLVIGILVAVLLCFATIIVESRVSSNSRDDKLNRIELGFKEHIRTNP